MCVSVGQITTRRSGKWRCTVQKKTLKMLHIEIGSPKIRLYIYMSTRRYLLAVCIASRTPVAPKGWPSDRLPPHRLNLAMSTLPTFCLRPIVSVANLSLSMALTLDRICPANASWYSRTSMSEKARPACSSTLGVA